MKLSDYGLIGNSRTAALVSRDGSIDWCCLPRFDSPAYFSSLLALPGTASAGQFMISPVGSCESRQAYLPDTNVLVTTFSLAGARARLIDSFSVSSQERKRQRLDPSQELLRVVEVEEGECEFEFLFRPVYDFGNRALRIRRFGKTGFCVEKGQELLGLHVERFPAARSAPDSAVEFSRVSDDASALGGKFTLKAGERMIFSLTHTDSAPAVFAPLGADAMERLRETIAYWRSWVSRCNYSGRFAEDVRRSALALKLLSFSPSGAIVAAPTTSLPEYPGGARNWDYRFCWLRDASFTVEVLASLGFTDEAKAYMGWLLHSTRLTWPRLQVVYSVYGRTKLRERELDWLPGFQGSRPVRVGNGAARQTQLDIYGEVVEAFYLVLPHLDRIDSATAKLLRGIGRTVASDWRKPDSGIWEPRGDPRHHTHSKLMSWVALDRLARIGKREGWKEAADFCSEAAKIHHWIENEAFSKEMGCYTEAPGSTELDSSLLVMPLLGFAHARSRRIRRTREQITARLSKGHLLYRYPPGSDGFPEPEGTFNLCTFWMAENLILAGELEKGTAWMEGFLSYRNSLGLWSEELLPETGEFLGNYPQAFTHIGLIHVAQVLERLESGVKGELAA